MSQENVEIARGVFDNFQAGLERGDHGAWVDSAAVADDFELPIPAADWCVSYFSHAEALEAAGLEE